MGEEQSDSAGKFWWRFLWCLCDSGVQEWALCDYKLEMLLSVWNDLVRYRALHNCRERAERRRGILIPSHRRLHWLEQNLVLFNYSHTPLSEGASLPTCQRLLVLLLSLVPGWQPLHQPPLRVHALKRHRTRWNFNDALILMVKPFRGKW